MKRPLGQWAEGSSVDKSVCCGRLSVNSELVNLVLGYIQEVDVLPSYFQSEFYGGVSTSTIYVRKKAMGLC